MNYPIVNQVVSTVTTSASGTASVIPVRSNTPFTDLTLIVRPLEAIVTYQVDVYFNGELSESHNYPDGADRVVAHMNYPNVWFPANVGVDTIPKYFDPNRSVYIGLPVQITITNNSSGNRSFEVMALFKGYNNCVFVYTNQEE